MPKNQSTAAKKARALQRTAGGKHTTLLADQICGERLDPFLVYPGTCARAPHPHDEPHSESRDFDAKAWRRKETARRAAEEARRAALSPEERAEEDERAREWEYEEMHAALAEDFDPYAKDYSDQD